MLQKLMMLLLYLVNFDPGQRYCVLNPRRDFRELSPIVLRNGRLLEPTEANGDARLESGDLLVISCEGAGFISHPNTMNPLSTARITCDAGNTFTNEDWLNGPSSFHHFSCSYPPNYFSWQTNRTCFESNPVYEVGYKIENSNHPVYETCFNQYEFQPFYSKYTQKSYNSNFQTKVDRPFFIADDMFGDIPMHSLFSPNGQKAAVAQLVDSMIDTYITGTQFLSRGHLAAKTDFVYAFTERATFHYVNCAPQWTGFNGGNWNTLEVDLRNHVNAAGYDTIVYTGVYGVSRLSNQFNQRVQIYLYTDSNNNPIIPLPKYFYKVVYDRNSRKGIAFVGINNPYLTVEEAKEMFFCEDKCRNSRAFSWLSWHPNNPAEGITFCCTIQDFKRTIKHLPDFEVGGLLT